MSLGPMTEAERYRFDLQGFLVRRGAIHEGDIAALNAAIDVLGRAAAGARPGQPALRGSPAGRPPLP